MKMLAKIPPRVDDDNAFLWCDGGQGRAGQDGLLQMCNEAKCLEGRLKSAMFQDGWPRDDWELR